MTARLIDGKAIAQTLRDGLKRDVTDFAAAHARPPGLTVVLVGEDPASVVYTRNKEKASVEAGIHGTLLRLPASATTAELLDTIATLNADDAVDGILVQLPLPKTIDPEPVLDAIDPMKDVDGFHPTNAGLLSVGRAGLVPCTPRGCMKLLESTGVPLSGQRAVVLGRSNIVGKPVAQLLLAANCTVTIAHSKTKDLPGLCREADVVVAAIGRAKFVKGDWIREGATVIDVGINRDDAGKLVGDVDTNAAAARAAFVTPVPGGVGPMTIACLLENTVIAARARLARGARA